MKQIEGSSERGESDDTNKASRTKKGSVF